MPMSEYVCRACGETFEELRSASSEKARAALGSRPSR